MGLFDKKYVESCDHRGLHLQNSFLEKEKLFLEGRETYLKGRVDMLERDNEKLREELKELKLLTPVNTDFLYRRRPTSDPTDVDYLYVEVSTSLSMEMIRFRIPDNNALWSVLPLREFNEHFEISGWRADSV